MYLAKYAFSFKQKQAPSASQHLSRESAILFSKLYLCSKYVGDLRSLAIKMLSAFFCCKVTKCLQVTYK